ncbi:MAG: hypothetical protein U9P81_02840 [Euryarchaeota archaeon]|nr:hypothetical protein [Euryarchaeota archaeon]
MIIKKRVSAFKRFDQENWNEEKIILGMLAALSGSWAIDHKEIVRKLLMGSLNEEENTIWGNIKKLGLENALWDMIRRRFGFLSEHPTLNKLFLSFIITHINRNGNITLKSYKQYINRQSNGTIPKTSYFN